MFQVNLALMNGEESRQKSTIKTKVLQFMFQFFLLSSILCFCVHTRWLNKSMGFLCWSVYSKRYSPDFHIVLYVVFYLVWQKGLKKREGGGVMGTPGSPATPLVWFSNESTGQQVVFNNDGPVFGNQIYFGFSAIIHWTPISVNGVVLYFNNCTLPFFNLYNKTIVRSDRKIWILQHEHGDSVWSR